jgi:hypothetical protein
LYRDEEKTEFFTMNSSNRYELEEIVFEKK